MAEDVVVLVAEIVVPLTAAVAVVVVAVDLSLVEAAVIFICFSIGYGRGIFGGWGFFFCVLMQRF